MENFLKFGELIKNNLDCRIKYHPLFNIRYLRDKKKKNKIFIKEYIVDIDHNNIYFNDEFGIELINSIKTLKLSKRDQKETYLIGNKLIKVKDYTKKIKELTFDSFNEKYLINYKDILNENSFIYKYRKILNNNIESVINKLDELSFDGIEEICLIFKIKYKNECKFAEEYLECLDELDKIFFKKDTIEYNNKYIFKTLFYNEFHYGKYINKGGGNLMPMDSIPFYSKDDLLSLYYGNKISSQTHYKINNDYTISVFPNYKNLSINDINELNFENINILDFNKVCKKISDFINSKYERDDIKKKIFKINLQLDFYFRKNGGNGIIDNILILSGIRYGKLLKIKDKINKSLISVYGKEFNFYYEYSLLNLFKDNENEKSDKYIRLTLKIIKNLFFEIYVVPETAYKCLISQITYLIRNDEDKNVKEKWNYLFKIYKFLKTMEDENYVNDLEKNNSYLLGKLLGEYEFVYGKDRENIKNFSEQFSGNISRRLNVLDDFIKYYNALTEKLNKNNYFINKEKKYEIDEILKKMSNSSFNKNYFILGYFTKFNFKKESENEKV